MKATVKMEPGILAMNPKGHPVLLSKRLWEELGREPLPGQKGKFKQSLYEKVGEGYSEDLNALLVKEGHRTEEQVGLKKGKGK